MTAITSPPTVHQPDSVANWLLSDSSSAVLAVDHVLTGRTAAGPRPFGKLSRVARAAVGREVVAALRAALPGQVVDLLVEGWSKHRSLAAATAVTRGQPDAERLVTLVAHQVRTVYEPTLDVIVDGMHVLTLFWRLDIVFDISEVIAVVRGGRLVALQAGNAKVTGTLALEGVEVARRVADFAIAAVLNSNTLI